MYNWSKFLKHRIKQIVAYSASRVVDFIVCRLRVDNDWAWVTAHASRVHQVDVQYGPVLHHHSVLTGRILRCLCSVDCKNKQK